MLFINKILHSKNLQLHLKLLVLLVKSKDKFVLKVPRPLSLLRKHNYDLQVDAKIFFEDANVSKCLLNDQSHNNDLEDAKELKHGVKQVNIEALRPKKQQII